VLSGTTNADGVASVTFDPFVAEPQGLVATCSIAAGATTNCGPTTATTLVTVVALTVLEANEIDCPCGGDIPPVSATLTHNDGVPVFHQLVTLEIEGVGSCTDFTNSDGVVTCEIPDAGACPLTGSLEIQALFLGSPLTLDFLCSSDTAELLATCDPCVFVGTDPATGTCLADPDFPCCELLVGNPVIGVCVPFSFDSRCPAGSICVTQDTCDQGCCLGTNTCSGDPLDSGADFCIENPPQGVCECPDGDICREGAECQSGCCFIDNIAAGLGHCVPTSVPGAPGCPAGSFCGSQETCATGCCNGDKTCSSVDLSPPNDACLTDPPTGKCKCELGDICFAGDQCQAGCCSGDNLCIPHTVGTDARCPPGSICFAQTQCDTGCCIAATNTCDPDPMLSDAQDDCVDYPNNPTKVCQCPNGDVCFANNQCKSNNCVNTVCAPAP